MAYFYFCSLHHKTMFAARENRWKFVGWPLSRGLWTVVHTKSTHGRCDFEYFIYFMTYLMWALFSNAQNSSLPHEIFWWERRRISRGRLLYFLIQITILWWTLVIFDIAIKVALVGAANQSASSWLRDLSNEYQCRKCGWNELELKQSIGVLLTPREKGLEHRTIRQSTKQKRPVRRLTSIGGYISKVLTAAQTDEINGHVFIVNEEHWHLQLNRLRSRFSAQCATFSSYVNCSPGKSCRFSNTLKYTRRTKSALKHDGFDACLPATFI